MHQLTILREEGITLFDQAERPVTNCCPTSPPRKKRELEENMLLSIQTDAIVDVSRKLQLRCLNNKEKVNLMLK